MRIDRNVNPTGGVTTVEAKSTSESQQLRGLHCSLGEGQLQHQSDTELKPERKDKHAR